MRIAVTGATGSLGGALIAVLAQRSDVRRVVAISRDEVKSGDLADRWADFPALRCQLGDVRDRDRMTELFRGCDIVIHAAALKRITHSAYSPEEVVKTNVGGTINVIQAATEAGVGRVVFVSSDKACSATNLYGATKFTAECYAIQQSAYSVPRGTRVAAVRYGNVMGSRGSVAHVWREVLARGKPLAITDARMTRFIITLPAAVDFVLGAVEDMVGGEVFVPRLPAARILDLAEAVEQAFGAARGRAYVGLRPGGEKLHEALLSQEEPERTWRESAHRMVVLPSHHSWCGPERWGVTTPRLIAPYTSDAPDRWLTVDELTTMVREAWTYAPR